MFTIEKYKDLVAVNGNERLCVSIHIPTYRAGNNQEDKLRLKNALSEAEQQLTDNQLFNEKAMSKQLAHEYMASAFDMLDDKNFWLNLSDGLVVFLSNSRFEFYTVPINFQNFVFVGNQFYLRHLFPVLTADEKFFILALSQNEVRFFEARKNSITPVKIKDLVPKAKKELIDVEKEEKSLQAHSERAGNVIYHGQSGGKDDKIEELKKYFREVDDGLMTMLHDETAPMVIYSVDYQIPIYKEISRYSNVSDFSITGNPEHDDPVLIHERAWSGMKDYFNNKKESAKKEFNKALLNDQASDSIQDIVPASVNGKVETLFIDSKTEEVWGIYNKIMNKVSIHKKRKADSQCLMNDTAIATFKNGGTVYNIPRTEFPKETTQMNAIYRY